MVIKTAPIEIQLKVAELQLECHPHAVRAWHCWRSLKRQFAPKELSPQLLQRLHESEPIDVISTAANSYKFVSGFPSVLLINGDYVKNAHLCVHSKLGLEAIERLAWDGVLKTILYNLDRKIGLASMCEAINEHMPAGLIREVFGKKTLSMPRLADMTGTTEDTIRYQLKLLLKPADRQKSILEQITEGKNA